MTIVLRALELLKEIYTKADKYNQPYELKRIEYNMLPSYKRKTLQGDLDYLEGRGYIRKFLPCAGCPISYQITPEGIDKIEGIVPEQNSSIIVNGTVNGIVGNNIIGNTINNGYSADDFRKLLETTISNKQELEEIKTAIEPLLQSIETGAPIEKGILASISSKIEKYQGILGPLGQTLITFLLTK